MEVTNYYGANVVLQWLTEASAWIGPDKIQIIEYDDNGSKLKIKLFTSEYSYTISANAATYIHNGYVGCIASRRKSNAGEEQLRGNDLPDGSLNYETFTRIMFAIVGYELEKINIRPAGVVPSELYPQTGCCQD